MQQETNKTGRGTNFGQWITAFWLYLLLFPFFVWTIEPYSSWLIALPLFFFLFAHQSKSIDFAAFVSFFAICLLGALCGGSNIVGMIMFCTIPFIFSADKDFLIGVYKKFRLIFVVLITLSLISYILVSIGLKLPFYVSPPPPRNTIDYNYFIYPFYACPSVSDWRALGIERFNGLFDEPGTVGTASLLLLYIEKMNLKKIGNIILLISGALSFSLYFYGGLFVLLTYFLLIGKTKLWVKVVYGLIIAASLVFIANNEITNELIWKRMMWDSSEKTIVGNDRSDYELVQYVKSIKGTSKYYFGSPEMVAQFNGSASIEKEIITHGFITLLCFFAFFVFYALKHLRFSRAWILFLVIFFANMFNRPSLFSYESLFIYMVAIFAYSKKYCEEFNK